MMNLEILRKKLSNGFRPFTIFLTDGRKFLVPHPDFVAIGRSVVVVIDKDDVANYIDPLHIVSLEERPARK